MRELVVKGIFLIVVAVFADRAYGLSETLREPKLFFPKNYDSERAKAVEQVLRSKQFRYVDGMTSYWPDKWPTTLVYEGNAESLSKFISALNDVSDITLRLTFSMDLAKETGSAMRAGSWWVKYAHTEPNVITIRINLAAEETREGEVTAPPSETLIPGRTIT